MVHADYTGRFSVWISPRITQYIPAGALFLVFVLTFFTWVGIRPGGVWVDSQSALQAMVGSISTADGMKAQSWFEGSQREQAIPNPMAGEAANPGFGFLMFLYVLLLLFNLLVTALAAAAPHLQTFVPPAMHQYLRWRWAAAALVTLMVFAVLLLQNARGLGLERSATVAVNNVTARKDKLWTEQQKAGALKDMDAAEIPKEVAMFRGIQEKAIVQTAWYRWAFWLHFWALVLVFITMLADLRAPRPSPRIDLLW